MSYEAKLQEMGYTLESVELDNGKFVLAVQTGNLIFTAGSVPVWGDTKYIGKIGSDFTVEEGYEAAKLCTLNCLQLFRNLSSTVNSYSTFSYSPTLASLLK